MNGTYNESAPGTCYAKCPDGYDTNPFVRNMCYASVFKFLNFGNLIGYIFLTLFLILIL
jgi:hypothetical protein